jgi:hypothetical protein
MKAYRWTVSTVWMLILLSGSAAQAQSLAGLSSAQLQRFSRDLVPSSSEDFFRKGREQFDRQIELLNRLPNLPDRILKVNPQIEYPKQNDRPTFSKPLAPPSGDRLKF